MSSGRNDTGVSAFCSCVFGVGDCVRSSTDAGSWGTRFVSGDVALVSSSPSSGTFWVKSSWAVVVCVAAPTSSAGCSVSRACSLKSPADPMGVFFSMLGSSFSAALWLGISPCRVLFCVGAPIVSSGGASSDTGGCWERLIGGSSMEGRRSPLLVLWYLFSCLPPCTSRFGQCLT